MTDSNPTPSELFDQAIDQPARRHDAIGALFAGLADTAIAAAAQRRALKKALRDARRNRPEAIAARKAAARRGWETRRQNAAETAAVAERELDTWAEGENRRGPRCNQMSHNSCGNEVFCHLDPDHRDDGREHDNGLGCTWPLDENEGEDNR
ncbi:hypothetical protein AB0C27_40615 [Nonomuraea sp. NPDC048882]|uniref:hypothetical protein n=1 Tax=Nonomuraea sp. NPDC048882 TaxID=3154347 RepID=UPI00340A1E63